ncbi:MAG TPA: alpha-1,2-fucosyltransferase [Chromatiaceae bacterium]|nr:alpha-1,2-fucosyltransferase [Chromatiaceae bacterium]
MLDNRNQVIVRLGGRLGNQMFQYATGRSLAARLNTSVEIEGFAPDSSHKSRIEIIDAFQLQTTLHSVKSKSGLKWRSRIARMGLPVRMRGLPMYVEPHFHYDPRFENIDGGRYLLGGWLSPRYFDGIRRELLEDFSLKHPLSQNATRVKESISEASCAISIHVRRGDYIENARTLARLGICERGYYSDAIDLIQKMYPDSQYYVFSDEPERARKELEGLNNLSFVSNNSQEEDLYLMSSCQHNIIANSTYSWWAAWLNENPEKSVIAPRQWFGPALQSANDTRDLFPENWRLI